MNRNYKTKTELLAYFLKGAMRYFALSACFAALVSLMDMIGPKIIAFTVDCVIGDKEPALPVFAMRLVAMAGGVETLRHHFLRIAAAAALTGILSALFRYLFRLCNARGSETFVKRMRGELFRHIMYLPHAWTGENNTGDLIQRCTSDVQTIKRFVSEQMTTFVRTCIMIVLALYFMAGINPGLTLICASFLPFVIGYSLFFHTRIGSAFEKADVEEGRLSTIAQENLTGVRVVRAFGREQYERSRFEKQNTYYTNYWIHLIKLLSAYWTSGDILTGSQILVITVLGSVSCVRGHLTAGDYIAMVSYNLMLTWPVRMLGRVISEMSKAGISIERLRYIMNAEPEKDVPQPVKADFGGDIVFDHVTFSYAEGTEPVLDDVSFTVPAGSTLGILGGTGSGKSTLMYLLERLYDIPEGGGSIRIGGTDIRQMKRSDLRRGIGMVLQEPYLFSRSLRENIALACDEVSEEDVRCAAGIACIDDAIASFTAGYETQVGERGVTLSGGQKQRTAIAQMLIRKPPVMIFDDSLSAVDAQTDQKIRKQLGGATEGSTVILIAHRISTLMHADHILVLDKGKILEEGTHEELLRRDGLYRKIYDLQTSHTREIA